MKPIDTLRKARRIIANPKRFCKGTCALDAEGNEVNPLDKGAKRYDALGAIVHVGGNSISLDYLRAAAADLYSVDVVTLNDSYDGRRKVLRCFDHAIKNLRG